MERVRVLLLSVVPGALAAYLGGLAVPFGLLVVCNVMDYVTGIMAAPARGQVRSSNRGFLGIAKKIAIWGLVAVAVVSDVLLAYVLEVLGWGASLPMMVACVASVWLLANELISIVENIDSLGVRVPFLMPVLRWVRGKAEDVGKRGIAEKREEDEEES